MTSVIRREIRKRNRFLKHYCKYKSPEAWEKYRIQRNFTTSCIRAAKKSYYANLNEKLQNPYTGINKWWGLIKTLYRNKIYSNIPVLLDDDKMIIDSKETAMLFNNYFCSVHKIEQMTLLYHV
jgi:hypothetical protein